MGREGRRGRGTGRREGNDREGRGGTEEGRREEGRNGGWGGEGRLTWAPPLETSSGSAPGLFLQPRCLHGAGIRRERERDTNVVYCDGFVRRSLVEVKHHGDVVKLIGVVNGHRGHPVARASVTRQASRRAAMVVISS